MKRLSVIRSLVIASFALCPIAIAQAGGDPVTSASNNPLAGNAEAIAAGGELFGKMNCAGCHGYDLAGGMGPDLTDPVWTYGGKPGDIYLTIAKGTPNGMPRWDDKLKPNEIWQIVSYIQSKAAH